MANTLGPYNPIFYAQEALIHLEKALGMAARIHRGYEAEWRGFNRGDVVTIRKPSTFTAQNAPSTAQDLAVSSVNITLNQWKEVKFGLTDKELTISEARIIEDHIRPAAYALADNIDQALAGLWVKVPWQRAAASTTDHTDITLTRKLLRDTAVPLDDGMVHMMVDSTLEANFLGLGIFHQAQIAGAASIDPLLRGTLGTRFGVEVFANQNVQSYTKGAGTDDAGTIDGGGNPVAAGSTSLTIDALTQNDVFKAGDTFTIAGDTQSYVIVSPASTTIPVGLNMTVTIYPALKVAAADGAVVTFVRDTGSQNLMFHRNFAALVVAPLTQLPAQLGANVATVSSEESRLSVRSRMYYDGDNSKVNVALDVLYGYELLDGDMAVRLVR